MSLKKRRRLFRKLTFRLTLWYAAMIGVLSPPVYLVVYTALASSLRERTDGELLDTAKEFRTLYGASGVAALQAEFRREAESQGVERVFFQLLSPRGETLAASDLSAWSELKAIPLPPPRSSKTKSRFETVSLPGRQYAVRTLSQKALDGALIRVGTTLRENERFMKKYRETSVTAFALMLIAGGFVGWVVAKRAMAGVERVTETAIRIGKGDLSRRVPLGREGEEIENLALAFNEMLERIEAAVGELKEVINHVAHDLRSPITRIRGVAETTLTGDDRLDAYREMAGTVIEESDRLVAMINTMLEIAQTESGVGELSRNPVDIREIIEDARDLFQPVAEDKGVRLESRSPSEPLTAVGDVSRLQRVLANLLDNAIKHTGSGGSVVVSAKAAPSQVVVEVIDTGEGISEEDLPRIFDRFYRADRSRRSPGGGLGLSLARAFVRAHGGDISVSSSLGGGSTFTVLLPRSS